MRRQEDQAKARQVAAIFAPLTRKEFTPDQIADTVIIVECFQVSGTSRTLVARRDAIIEHYCEQAGLALFTKAARDDAQDKIDGALATDLPIWVIAHLADGHMFSTVIITRQGGGNESEKQGLVDTSGKLRGKLRRRIRRLRIRLRNRLQSRIKPAIIVPHPGCVKRKLAELASGILKKLLCE
jgi:hypothetical protein